MGVGICAGPALDVTEGRWYVAVWYGTSTAPAFPVLLQAIILTVVQALLLWVFLRVLHWGFFPSLLLAGAVGMGIWFAMVRLFQRSA